ncbi:MAG: GNAT family N-acetyltransferase [Kangiellaceae bacterium]|nr:GNAT family N-acetyltransferase [Kangiellaceae bacterium]MCW9015464.1 GNAT family N-acetyltransferase [Kangiellaceae bacterium]
MIIRPAVKDDLPQLLEFEQGIIEYERPFDETLKKTPISYYDIKAMIQAPDIEVVVAEEGNQLIGSGYAKVIQSKPYLTHSKHAYLGFMFVSEEARGKGVNKKIIAKLEEWAKLRGINEVRLDVYAENSTAVRAYEKAGFIKNLVEMRKPI